MSDHPGWLLRVGDALSEPPMMLPWMRRSAGLLLALPLLGTVGYALIEGWNLFDSLYMSIITVTTIGYGEVHPLSEVGRAFTIVYILAGVGVVGHAASNLATFVADGGFLASLRTRRARTELNHMRDHYVVVGYGRLGREIVAELTHHGAEVVVIDREAPETLAPGVRLIVGDATQDDTLKVAGIERARGLAVATPADAVNVYVTLSARQLNPGLVIHTRVEDDGAGHKAKRAGADGVIQPYHLGGSRMAMGLLRPASLDFVEHATQRQFDDLHMEDVLVGPTTSIRGRLGLLDLHATRGVSIVALRKKSDGQLVYPDATATIGTGDMLVVVGPPDRVVAFVAEAST